MFSEDELDQARAVPVLEIAERHGARLKRSGHELIGPCPVCGGVDRFAILPSKNLWNCRGCRAGGDTIAAEMHLGGRSFVDAVRALIGEDAGTPTRRQRMPDEIAARAAREVERKRAEAEEWARNESSAAKIIARLQPVAGTPGEIYLRDVRKIDVSHWAIRRALEDVDAIGWCERTYVNELDSKKPLHPYHGQHLGAIVAILTDPVTGERTGGITRTYLHEGRKICRAMSLGGAGRLGIIRLSPDDEVGRVAIDPWLEPIETWLKLTGRTGPTTFEIARDALTILTSQINSGHHRRVADIMRSLGWVQKARVGNTRPWRKI
jgi:hypothetical protein